MNTQEEILNGVENFSSVQPRSAAGLGRGPMRLWLVDDNATFRDLLAALLTADGDMECTGQFPSPTPVLNTLRNKLPPDAILGAQNGIDAIRPIKELASSVHVFMLTTFYDHDRKLRALEHGASGFLLKSYPATEIQRQLRLARDQPAPIGILSPTTKTTRDTTFDAVSPASTRVPKRRVNGRSDPAGAIALHSEHARQYAPWRSASSRLLRSVGHLRALLGLF